MTWSTYLFSALLAMMTPTHAAPPTRWTVLVGGATADTSIYANAFFPQAIEIGVGDTVTWTFAGVTTSPSWVGAPRRRSAFRRGTRCIGIP